MLQRLFIENYATIEQLELDFSKGFTVMTGETGAGKSILLGALSLILGQRAETRVIKEGKVKCTVEAEFNIELYSLESFLLENDLEYSPESCLIRRELYSNGKNRAFVNDSPVSLSVLKDLTNQLIDIHSQHQNLMVGKDSFQLEIVDLIAGNSNILEDYQNSYSGYRELKEKFKQLESNALRAKEEEDYIRFQFDQLKSSDLIEGEQEKLDAEWDMLTHAEEIKTSLGKMNSLLDNDENGILQRLKLVINQADITKKSFSKFVESTDRLKSNFIDIQDISSEIEKYLNDVEINPSRLEKVNERINMIYGLQQKHHLKSVGDLIKLRDDLKNKLQKIESFDGEILSIKKDLAESEKITLQNSEKLSSSRKKVLKSIEHRLISLLIQLGIPKASIIIKIEDKIMDSSGSDKIRFLFSANKNNSPQPIDEIASGGEISRIMLCLKYMLSDSINLPTLFFDEIDTGISGEIAYKMAEIMRELADKRQVICITHLPQIAASGKVHFKVKKTENDEQSITTVSLLSENERLMEIAQMLSGAIISDAAIKNAQSLLNESGM